MNTRSRTRLGFNLLMILVMAFTAVGPAVAQEQIPAAPPSVYLPMIRTQGNSFQAAQFTATPLVPDSVYQGAFKAGPDGKLVSVIVKLDVQPLVEYSGGIAGLAPTSPNALGTSQVDPNSPSSQAYLAHVNQVQDAFVAAAESQLGAGQVQVTNRYDVILGGLSMIVPVSKVEQLAGLPGVQAILPDELLQVDTDNSAKFIGAPSTWAQMGGQENAGEGVVVGVLDTGIWPEHPSFSDPDPSGKPYTPLASWHGTTCQFGSATPGDVPFTCNNKLVGAREYLATYKALVGLLPTEFDSARDDNGHGTHTSSTSAGNANVSASIFGVPRGKVTGMAPRARVAMYRVCAASGCYSSDSAAAVQQAILDGVNVINFSISGGTSPYSDAVSLAFLNAYDAGVFVAASAGNSGPGADTTGHREPWVTTVAASTQNRAFESTATVTGDGGASLTFSGASITAGAGPAPILVPPDPQCNTPLAAGSAAGMIVLCQRGVTGRAEKGYNAFLGGAVGMILYNQAANVTDLETDNHFLPAIHIQYAEGTALLAFLAAHTNVQASFTAGVKVSAQGDVMASFSSRGGTGQSIGVSKPDVTAPGVQILAGHTPLHVPPPAGVAEGPEGELFQAIAGTSMSSPHVAGAGALLKSLYPTWTPMQIKSALMLTAYTKVVKEDGVTPADAFDDGSGRIDLKKAWATGLTMNASATDFIVHQNDLWNANYPSFYHPAMPGIITVQRTVHNEKPYQIWWKLTVKAPPDVKITVPEKIFLPANGDATFDITIDARDVPSGQVRFAMLNLSDFSKTPLPLHMPITFVRKEQVVTVSKTCAPASIVKGAATTCTLTAANTTFSDANIVLSDALPNKLQLVPGSVVGGVEDGNGVKFTGLLAAAQPPNLAIGPGSSPAGGYLPLSLFGIAPIAGVGDDTITNFNVPAFLFGGETYTRIGVASNGYLVIGGGSGADNSINNQLFPNPNRPNNVVAGFWTDLNPAAAGALRIATLTDGVNTWIVVDYAAVREFSLPNLTSFEIWIQIAPGPEQVSLAYGPVGGNGDGGFLSVGVENRFGNRGQNVYYNGTGTLPANGTQLLMTSTPGTPGGTQTITFQAKGRALGDWVNYALLTSDLFQGTSVARFAGTVTAP